VSGYNGLCEDFDYPFNSLVEAARIYLELQREGMNTVFFIDARTERTHKLTRVQKRLSQMALFG
jgi:hypothetical protein